MKNRKSPKNRIKNRLLNKRKRKERRREKKDTKVIVENAADLDTNGNGVQAFERARQKKHGSCHHIFPTSRGGPKEEWKNKYVWPGVNVKEREEKHRAWHQMFFNLLPSEVIRVILGWTTKEGELNDKLVGEKNLEAWKTAFERRSPYEAIVLIIERFIPIETECFKKNSF